jgi:hypothetical protein
MDFTTATVDFATATIHARHDESATVALITDI